MESSKYNWHETATKLSELGWSWRHTQYGDRSGGKMHIAEASNDYKFHAVAADEIDLSFAALEQSIQTAR